MKAIRQALNRRTFFRIAAAAPFAAQQAAAQAGEVAATLGKLGLHGGVRDLGASGAGSGRYYGLNLLADKKLHLAHKAGLLPDWAREEIEDHIRSTGHVYNMHPDVHALKSISLSAQWRINHDRQMRKGWTSLEQGLVNKAARDMFYGADSDMPGACPPKPARY